MKQEAKEIFKNKLEDERSFRSYAEHQVLYEIQANKLTLKEFEYLTTHDIAKKQWKFYKKINQGYIFCRNKQQLEVIPPQILVGNEVLGKGDVGLQYENDWNIFLLSPASGGIYVCYSES